MANKKKKSKVLKANRAKRRYRKGGTVRLDMRKGGRVGFAKAGKARREKRQKTREQRRIDRRNARKSKSGEEAGTRESLPTPGDIASANAESPYGYMGPPPETDTGLRGTQNIPGPSGFDT